LNRIFPHNFLDVSGHGLKVVLANVIGSGVKFVGCGVSRYGDLLAAGMQLGSCCVQAIGSALTGIIYFVNGAATKLSDLFLYIGSVNAFGPLHAGGSASTRVSGYAIFGLPVGLRFRFIVNVIHGGSYLISAGGAGKEDFAS
jgi:hypothetical protein